MILTNSFQRMLRTLCLTCSSVETYLKNNPMGIQMYRLPNKYSYIKPAAALTQSSWGKRDKVRPCVVNKPACQSLVGMQLFFNRSQRL